MFAVITSSPTLNRPPRLLKLLALSAMLLTTSAGFVHSQDSQSEEPTPGMYITEYRVIGAKKLDRRSVEKAVYPFLGPERTPEDVDAARAALEKAYRDAGYSTVSVLIPQQKVKKGVVLLQVSEAAVGRLRVHGSRYYDIERLKRRAPSMAEGTVPNFNDVNRDLIALNRSAGLRVTPALRAGSIPGTVDIDQNVEDKLPLQGSIELNNRYSQYTTPWRLSGGLSYTNLWQSGHSIGGSFQFAPERRADAEVYSAYYLAPIPGFDDWKLTLQGSKQNSNIAILSDQISLGRGQTFGLRLTKQLPEKPGLYHSLSFGLDYKSYEPSLIILGVPFDPGITYYPFSLNYAANWIEEKYSTELTGVVNFHIPRFGSNVEEFYQRRYQADDGYIYFRGDLSHTHDLAGGFEGYVSVQAQISSGPLISNEQFSAGGASTVRGYLEATSVGDNGVIGSVELRSPSLLKKDDKAHTEWRFYAFAEAGYLTVNTPLPEQESNFTLASVGVGTKFRILNHLSGSVDAGLPLIQQGVTDVGELFISISFMADF